MPSSGGTEDPMVLEDCSSLQEDEITVLESIYPDGISVLPNLQNKPGRIINLVIPISLGHSIATRISTPPSISPIGGVQNGDPGPSSIAPSSLSLSHLPPISARISLPSTYPLRSPPKVIAIRANLSTSPPISYLSKSQIGAIQDRLGEIWVEERDSGGGEGTGVLWRYYDWISSCEALRDLDIIKDDQLNLTVPPTLSNATIHTALRSYNARQLHQDFESTAYSCGICLETRPGNKCVEMPNCGCVFCMECLHACWTLAITEGSLESVGCPSVDCVKARSSRRSKPGESAEEISPEVIENVVGKDLRARWESLKDMRLAEIDPRYTTCPQPGCQATVPPPPEPLPPTTASSSSPLKVVRLADLHSASPPDSQSSSTSTASSAAAEDRWARYRCCPSCHFSFCTYCSSSWHGAHTACQFPQTSVIIREYLSYPENSPERRRMEVQRGKANLERMIAKFHEDEENRRWLESQTMPCAGCGVRVEKSHGCNHMTCGRCGAHFCFRCGASLRPTDPYVHYNTPGSSCFEKLFDAAEIARYEREAEQQRMPIVDQEAGPNADDLAAELAMMIQIHEFDEFERRQTAARRRGRGR